LSILEKLPSLASIFIFHKHPIQHQQAFCTPPLAERLNLDILWQLISLLWHLKRSFCSALELVYPAAL